MEEAYQYQLITDPETKVKLLREYGFLKEQIKPDKDFPRLVLLAFSEGKRVGMAQGCFNEETSVFFVLSMLLLPEYRSAASIRSFLRALLQSAKQQYPCCTFGWHYFTKAEVRDPYEKIVQGLPELAADIKSNGRKYRVNLTGFRHRGDTYTAEHMQELGFRVIHRSEMTKQQTETLQELCENAGGDLAALNPFVSEYDDETSLMLVDLATENVCAWMICRKKDDQLLDVRRWYVLHLPSLAKKRAGLYFAGYWIRLIAEKYTKLEFYVMEENRTMQRFSNAYFGGSIQEIVCDKIMTMKYINE